MVSKEEFEQEFARRRGITVEELHARKLHAVPCQNCDYGNCQGWAIADADDDLYAHLAGLPIEVLSVKAGDTIVLSHPYKLSAEAVQRIKRAWDQLHIGPEKNKVIVLEEGMKISAMRPEEGQ